MQLYVYIKFSMDPMHPDGYWTILGVRGIVCVAGGRFSGAGVRTGR